METVGRFLLPWQQTADHYGVAAAVVRMWVVALMIRDLLVVSISH
jgi:hypothetical protein